MLVDRNGRRILSVAALLAFLAPNAFPVSNTPDLAIRRAAFRQQASGTRKSPSPDEPRQQTIANGGNDRTPLWFLHLEAFLKNIPKCRKRALIYPPWSKRLCSFGTPPHAATTLAHRRPDSGRHVHDLLAIHCSSATKPTKAGFALNELLQRGFCIYRQRPNVAEIFQEDLEASKNPAIA